MVEDLGKIFLKVFHRALGLTLFSAMTVDECVLTVPVENYSD